MNELAERFFADCSGAGVDPCWDVLKSGLWFTCPAHLRAQAQREIEGDPRYHA